MITVSLSTIISLSLNCNISSILRSLHWLRITDRIEYKLLSLTYKVLTTTQPPYLHNLISVQRPCSTRLSPVVTLARLAPTSSSKNYWSLLSLMLHLFYWINPLYLFFNPILVSIRLTPLFPIQLFLHPITSFSFDSPLCSSITPSLFHSRLKTCLFHKSYPVVSLLPAGLPSRIIAGPFLLSYSVIVFSFSLFFRFCAVR